MLGHKKGEKKELCGQMPAHYPADRVYLDGDKTKTVQDKILKSAEIDITSQSVSANSIIDLAFPASDWNGRTCISVVLKSTNGINAWLVGQPVYRPNALTKWNIIIANLYDQALTLEGTLIVYYR